MRHRKRRTKLGMMSDHKSAAMNNIVRSLIKYQRIQTTLRRAKEARRIAEQMITLTKSQAIEARRRAFAVLTDRDLVAKLFNDIGPLFKDRMSGFTRIVPLGFRRGDGASMCILELTERKIVEKAPRKKKEEQKSEDTKRSSGADETAPKVKSEKSKKHDADVKSETKSASTVDESPKEEKKEKHSHKPSRDESKKAEKSKKEDKSIGDKKKFLTNLRGFFHRKNDM